jgi:phosphoethanolamine N-methyltransferase
VVIYHVTDEATWAGSLAAGVHTSSSRGLSLADEGFIHCSTAAQVDGVLSRFYAGVSNLLLLHVDLDLLTSPLRYDEVPGVGAFPHVYGPVNLDAVVHVEPIVAPAELPHDYDRAMIDLLQLLWGDGFLSPGGPQAVTEIIAPAHPVGASVLDIGCGAGGAAMVIAALGAARVVGVDPVDELIELAKASAAGSGAAVEFLTIQPERSLPFADDSFDIVFSKDSWLHVIDKEALLDEVRRVLRPGGRLAAGDWMKGPLPYSNDMLRFIELEGIPYHQATLDEYVDMLDRRGFVDIRTEDTTPWYTALAADEHRRLRGELYEEVGARLGAAARDHFIEDWRMLTVVTAAGELRPSRMWATKPADAASR